jgi:membrane peptidoglycan carboxypeptidase
MSVNTEDPTTPADADSPPPAVPPTGDDSADGPRGRRTLTGLVIAVVVLLVLGVGGFWATYAKADLPPFPALAQTTRIEYADGTTFATFGTQNRQVVKLSQVPPYVQNEVVAIEDPEFWDEDGSVVGATARTIWSLVTGHTKASSSITEQYIVNSINLGAGRRGRAKVPVIAQKLSVRMSKQQILQAYLNTMYFGRSAWGIEAAAKGYFNKDISKVTPAEGAVLAGLISSPTKYDPHNDPAGAKSRWNAVLNATASKGFMTSADRIRQVYPAATLTAGAPDLEAWRTGSTGVLGYRIEQELLKIGFTEQDIHTGGLVVKTSIRSAAQAAAVEDSTAKVNAKVQDPRMGTATVSINPATGAVEAYYGGEAGYGNLDLAASAAPHPAGSSFMPYALATALAKGYSFNSLWNGTSGQIFPDRATPLKNDNGDNSCGTRCSLTAATAKSLNTVYWSLTSSVGYKSVAKTAQAAGIQNLDGLPVSTQLQKSAVNDGIGLGQYSISVLDQAAGYATMANYGTYHQPYFVSQVSTTDGSLAYDHNTHAPQPVQAWSKDVGRDLTYVLEQVYNANRGVSLGRQGALKPGTAQYQNAAENSDAWLAGYVPQLATATWVGSKDSKNFPLRDKTNKNTRVSGTGIPGQIWTQYMRAALRNTQVESFLTPLRAGTLKGNAPN